MHCGKKWWIQEFVAPYIFPLNPDYVAARSLRSLRNNKVSCEVECTNNNKQRPEIRLCPQDIILKYGVMRKRLIMVKRWGTHKTIIPSFKTRQNCMSAFSAAKCSLILFRTKDLYMKVTTVKIHTISKKSWHSVATSGISFSFPVPV